MLGGSWLAEIWGFFFSFLILTEHALHAQSTALYTRKCIHYQIILHTAIITLAIKIKSYKCNHCKLTKTTCTNVQALFKNNNADSLKIENAEIQRQDTQETNDWFLKKVGGSVNCFSANVLETALILARMQHNFSIQRYSTESQHGTESRQIRAFSHWSVGGTRAATLAS